MNKRNMFGYTVHQFGVDTNTLPVLDSLVAWFDAADLNTITESSGDLSQWDDKSGNGHHATQGVGADQPSFVTDVVNGLPVVRFNGTSDFLDLGSVVISGTTGRTFFLVCRADNTGTAEAMISLSTSGANGGRYDLTGQISLRVVAGFRQFTVSIVDASNYFVLSVWNAASSDVSATEGRRNGTALVQASVNTQAIDTQVSGTTRLGENGVSNQFYDGDLSEVIMYDRELSASEIDSVESYLAAKWGITLA